MEHNETIEGVIKAFKSDEAMLELTRTASVDGTFFRIECSKLKDKILIMITPVSVIENKKEQK